MGEYADMILEGFACQQCGCVIDYEETGYARLCEDCERETVKSALRFKKKKNDSACKQRVDQK